VEEQRSETFAELEADLQSLKQWMSSHLTSAKLPEVVQEVKALDEISETNDLATLADVREGVRTMIDRLGLASELDAGNGAAGQSGSGTSQEGGRTTYAVTDLNKALLRGPL
jgi:hypothetical protein